VPGHKVLAKEDPAACPARAAAVAVAAADVENPARTFI
jgi:hypothetical protein